MHYGVSYVSYHSGDKWPSCKLVFDAYSVRSLSSDTPDHAAGQVRKQERQNQYDGFAIDIDYGRSFIENGYPHFRVMTQGHLLFLLAWPFSGTFWRLEIPTPADMIYVGLIPSEMPIE
jgi:hypothetical protein